MSTAPFASAQAGHGCHKCGCCEHVEKVCHVVCEMKDVKTTVYGFECEDFCTACKSKKCGCQEIPICGKVRTKKKLTKIECVKKVPTYKCVVQYLCRHCSQGCQRCSESECTDCAHGQAEGSPTEVPAPEAADAPSDALEPMPPKATLRRAPPAPERIRAAASEASYVEEASDAKDTAIPPVRSPGWKSKR